MNTSTLTSDKGSDKGAGVGSDTPSGKDKPTRRRKLKRAILVGLGMLIACEVVASLLYQQNVVYPGAVWYWEHTGDRIHDGI